MEKQQLRMSEDSFLRRICGRKREEIKWMLDIDDHHNLYPSPNIYFYSNQIKDDQMCGVRHTRKR
jgi:hypothetical protein